MFHRGIDYLTLSGAVPTVFKRNMMRQNYGDSVCHMVITDHGHQPHHSSQAVVPLTFVQFMKVRCLFKCLIFLI